jgi:hypothetical protein
MPKFLMIALNGPAGGQEADFNTWYDNVHVPELLTVKGFKSAKRYKTIGGTIPEGVEWPYVAVYEIEADNFQDVIGDIGKSMKPFPACFDNTRSNSVFAVQISED